MARPFARRAWQAAEVLTVAEAVALADDPLDAIGLPRVPCAAVLLDGPVEASDATALAALARSQVVVGVLGCAPDLSVVASLTLSLGASSLHAIDRPLGGLSASIDAAPRAATVLAQLLHATSSASARDGVVTESLAYSMLLGGPEFVAWRESHPRRRRAPYRDDAVIVTRTEGNVEIVLNRGDRHNAFSAELRDALVDALQVARDPTVRRIVLRGVGPSFSSGGDLDEFGTATDGTAAHVLRVARSAGLAIDAISGRVEARLHGACIGAGIEVPAFAAKVVAAPDTRVRLPELALGIVPGAGGTVSVTRRIGRWRTAWLALSGEEIDARTALVWGLVDEVSA